MHSEYRVGIPSEPNTISFKCLSFTKTLMSVGQDWNMSTVNTKTMDVTDSEMASKDVRVSKYVNQGFNILH